MSAPMLRRSEIKSLIEDDKINMRCNKTASTAAHIGPDVCLYNNLHLQVAGVKETMTTRNGTRNT